MNYLSVVLAVWAIVAICAVLFIRGATRREVKLVQMLEHEPVLATAKKIGHTA
jgi:hypothetical protein